MDLPTGEGKIKDPEYENPRTATGRLYENRLVGKCSYEDGNGWACEGVAYKGFLYGKIKGLKPDGEAAVVEVVKSQFHGKFVH